MADSIDPDQTSHSAASDLGLNCLLRPACPIHRISKYGNLIKSTPHPYPSEMFPPPSHLFFLSYPGSGFCEKYKNCY